MALSCWWRKLSTDDLPSISQLLAGWCLAEERVVSVISGGRLLLDRRGVQCVCSRRTQEPIIRVIPAGLLFGWLNPHFSHFIQIFISSRAPIWVTKMRRWLNFLSHPLNLVTLYLEHLQQGD